MDIQVYENVFDGLVEYNEKIGKPYNNTVAHFETAKPQYPLTIIEEIRNVANRSYNTCYDRISSIGYKIDVYAKTKGAISKQTIAREIAHKVDKYMTDYVGLSRISYNVEEIGTDKAIFHIIMTYSGNLHENRRKFI